ncbi:MAG: aminoacetone oxidase family FAD-binding enzyme [Lachnospiraceae bacterium]|nr:aminoacetone oxidase family FAD-binding enzyme [Lachnospiraceae bacterium]
MKIGIVGGGAAGLAAAVTACQAGADVVVLEQNDRVGKKILSTGNGKCNFSNTRMGAKYYHSETADLLSQFVFEESVPQVLDFFTELGMLYREKNGGYYPYSEQAQTVLDVLRFKLDSFGDRVRVRTGCKVTAVIPLKNGKVRLEFEAAAEATAFTAKKGDLRVEKIKPEHLSFDRVILACGGKAAPKTGSDGSGYRFLKDLGLNCVSVVPALVQLVCKEKDLKMVSGVRTQAVVRLFVDGKLTDTQKGELQLTDYGISGIVVFQLSRYAAYGVSRKKEVTAEMDVMPEYSKEEWTDTLLTRKKRYAGQTAEQFCSGLLHKKLCAYFMKHCGINPQQLLEQVTEAQIREFAHLCKCWCVTVVRTNGFDAAQVCAGGLSLKEINPDFSLKKYPQIYAVGELLDVDGVCGGYNLHWAWLSGMMAAKSASVSGAGNSEAIYNGSR